jgi:dihydroorotase
MKLVEDEELSLNQALAALTMKPADILGIDAGRIKTGAIADICIIDPHADYECIPLNFMSAGKNSPFNGWLFHHQVSHTLFHGRLVFKR